jgi:hypothetical protein
MLLRRVPLLVLVVLAAMAISPAHGQLGSDEPPARLLFWHRDGDRIIVANIRFSRTDELELDGREQLEETASSNAVLVLVTNRRFLAYSVFTASWQAVDRRVGETLEQLAAEDYAGYVLSSKRVLNFNGRTAVWSEGRR